MSQFPLEIWLRMAVYMNVRTVHKTASTCRKLYSLRAWFLQEHFTADNLSFEAVFSIEGSPHVKLVTRCAKEKGLSFDLPILLSVLNNCPRVTMTLLEASGTQQLDEGTLNALLTFAAEQHDTVLMTRLCGALGVLPNFGLALSRPLAWAAETGDAAMVHFLLNRGALVTSDIMRAARHRDCPACTGLLSRWSQETGVLS